MNESSFVETLTNADLSDQTKLRLNEINKKRTILILKSKKERQCVKK